MQRLLRNQVFGKHLVPGQSIQKQPPEVFYKKGVLKSFAKFTGKHLCQTLFFKKVLTEHFWTTASEYTLLFVVKDHISVSNSESYSWQSPVTKKMIGFPHGYTQFIKNNYLCCTWWRFALKISWVNVNESADNCGSVHIYKRNIVNPVTPRTVS